MAVRVRIQLLKELREKKKLTQEALAAAADVSLGTVRSLEQGKGGHFSTVSKLAKVLEADPADLVLEDEVEETDDYRKQFADYFAAIKEVFGSIRFLGLAHRVDERNVAIEKMFVEPELCDRYVDPNLPLAQWPKRRGLLEALRDNHKLVVLGDPGSGKSTIVNMIACQLADKRMNPWRQALNDAIPVPIVLRELVLPPKYSFDELLEAALQQTELGRCLSQKDMRLVIDAVHEGRAIVLLDGIDELSDVARREALHKAVWEGIKKHEGCRFVMTSRITGHDVVPFHLSPKTRAQRQRGDIPEERRKPAERTFDDEGIAGIGLRWYVGDSEIWNRCPVHYVVPFDDVRIESFALNWYRQREESERRAKEKADALTDAVQRDEGTFILARIPNLLTLMALIHRLEADLPHGKARLYAEIAAAYLEKIDNYRKITERPDSPLDKKRWLAYAAFEMQKRRSSPAYTTGPANKKVEEKREILVTRQELHGWIAEGMKASGKYKNEADVTAFIDHIQRRSGLLIERGADLFAFTHLSFQEYFAAWHMSQFDHRDELEFKQFAEFVDQSAWLETFCFYFEIIAADRVPQKQEPIRRRLLGWEDGTDLPPDKDNRAVLLARLARDRYSGLGEELAQAAVTACLKWEAAQQNSKKPWEHSPLVLRTLLGGHENPAAVLEEFVAEARKVKATRVKLSGMPVSDLTPLAGLTSLQELFLNGTQVTDLQPLAGLTSLQSLHLQGTAVMDLQPLAGLTRLRYLLLQGTGVGDLQPLAGLRILEWLKLSGTAVTDLQSLAGLTSLWSLDLSGTAVTDLQPLAGLTSLKELWLIGTAVTKEQVAALEAALPKLIIYGP